MTILLLERTSENRNLNSNHLVTLLREVNSIYSPLLYDGYRVMPEVKHKKVHQLQFPWIISAAFIAERGKKTTKTTHTHAQNPHNTKKQNLSQTLKFQRFSPNF